MINRDELYRFLLMNYRHSRFEGRGLDKAQRITDMYVDDLTKYEYAHVSRHEDVHGQGFKFVRQFNIFRGEPVEYPVNAGNLTHIF